MGIYVILDIDPRGISPSDWAAAYDETAALLLSFQPTLLGYGERLIEGSRVTLFQRNILREDGSPNGSSWCVVGDRETMQVAEEQAMYRDLGRYFERGALRAPSYGSGDIVADAARFDNPDTAGPVQVFGNKTQGCPYHLALLTVGMLLEERFPKQAMTRGNISRAQAEAAQEWAKPVLGRTLPLPIRVDARRLLDRLALHMPRPLLTEAFLRMFLDSSAHTYETILRVFPGDIGAKPWKDALSHYASARAIGAKRLFIQWLNAERPARELAEYVCFSAEGPRFPREDFVDALAAIGVALPATSVRTQRPALEQLLLPPSESLLDWKAPGAPEQHLRSPISTAELASVLTEVFGKAGVGLAERLQKASARLQTQLAERAVADKGLVPVDTTEALITLGLPSSAPTSPPTSPPVDGHVPGAPAASLAEFPSLGPVQRLWFDVVLLEAVEVLARYRADPHLSDGLNDVNQARSFLVRALSARGPVLTEDAWDAILAEKDLDVLAWRLALASMGGIELHQAEVRRALLENPALLRHARDLANDEGQMLQIRRRFARGHRAGW